MIKLELYRNIASRGVYLSLIDTFTEIQQFGSVKNTKNSINKTKVVFPYSDNIIGKFQANDVVKVYDDDKILFVGLVSDYGVKYTVQGTITFELTCLDSEYVAFNKVWSEQFDGTHETDRAPFIIGKILSNTAISINGDGSTKVGVKFVGYPRTDGIQVTRPDTNYSYIEFTYDDILNNTAAYQSYVSIPEEDKFPKIPFSFNFKGVKEWINELSQIDIVNTATELDNNNPKIKRAMFHYLDVDNNFIWFSRETPNDSNDIITLNDVLEFNLQQKISDNINFIIAYLGKDYNDAPVYIYEYNDYSGTPNTNESIRTWTDIERDKKKIYSDTQNDELREAMRKAGKARARELFKLYSEGIIKGSMKLVNTDVSTIGSIITINLPEYGYNSIKARVISESYAFDLTTGVTKEIEIEEEV